VAAPRPPREPRWLGSIILGGRPGKRPGRCPSACWSRWWPAHQEARRSRRRRHKAPRSACRTRCAASVSSPAAPSWSSDLSPSRVTLGIGCEQRSGGFTPPRAAGGSANAARGCFLESVPPELTNESCGAGPVRQGRGTAARGGPGQGRRAHGGGSPPSPSRCATKTAASSPAFADLRPGDEDRVAGTNRGRGPSPRPPHVALRDPSRRRRRAPEGAVVQSAFLEGHPAEGAARRSLRSGGARRARRRGPDDGVAPMELVEDEDTPACTPAGSSLSTNGSDRSRQAPASHLEPARPRRPRRPRRPHASGSAGAPLRRRAGRSAAPFASARSEDDVALLNAARGVAHRRLILEELFLFQLGLALRRRGVRQRRKGIAFEVTDRARDAVKRILPFHLTAAQKRVLRQIAEDMKSPHPMNRLVQGDVGSGKTMVALLSMVIAVENGHQARLHGSDRDPGRAALPHVPPAAVPLPLPGGAAERGAERGRRRRPPSPAWTPEKRRSWWGPMPSSRRASASAGSAWRSWTSSTASASCSGRTSSGRSRRRRAGDDRHADTADARSSTARSLRRPPLQRGHGPAPGDARPPPTRRASP